MTAAGRLLRDWHSNFLCVVVLVFLCMTVAGFPARAQERADCHVLRSAILHVPVNYCVFLPNGYASAGAKARRYPVLYLLHGLGGSAQDMALSGEWTMLQDLRRNGTVGDFLVVAPQAWGTFYVNSRDGKTPYSDFFLKEFIPFIERGYRVRSERAARGITGFSMGGYGALRFAFAHPELFGSVSAHSAALMRNPPQGINASASAGNPAAEILTDVFGDPIDRAFWDLNSPFQLAEKHVAALKNSKIYFDCGTEDSYGFYQGASELHRELERLKISHEFHLYPGGHNMAYLLAHSEASFVFHWREFATTH